MDAMTKSQLKGQLTAIAGQNSAVRAMASAPVPNGIDTVSGHPILLDPSLNVMKSVMQQQADTIDKLLKFLSELVDKN